MTLSRFAPNRDRINPVHITLAVAILVMGAWLRVRGAQGELWLDEIWSLNIAAKLTSWHQAFWNAPADNNHPINTMWLYLLGADRPPYIYRLLSILTSTTTILATGLIAMRPASGNRPARLLIAMLLVAALYPFVHFGSEARGYAPMMLAAVLAFSAVETADKSIRRARWPYGIAGFIGVLSHLSILPILCALSINFAVRKLLQGRSLAQAIDGTVRLNGPLAGGLLVYVAAIGFGIYVNGNALEFGGSTIECTNAPCFTLALDTMTRFTVGGFGADWVGLYTGLYGILVMGAIAWLGAIGNRRALPLGLILLGVPLLFFVTNQPAIPHGRYFIGVFIFVPILIAEIIGEVSGRAKVGRLFAGFFVLVLVASNAWAINRFLQAGRGDYARTLARMMKDQGGAPLTIGTEMPFQLRTVMDHTRDRHASKQRIDYVTFRDIPHTKPPWVISVTLAPKDIPAAACAGGLLYALDSIHGYWGMAGTTWGLYALSDSPAPDDCTWLTDGRK